MVKNLFQNEEAHTIIETVVALSIFISVLIPLGSFLGYFIITNDNKDEIIAISMGRDIMEKTIASTEYSTNEFSFEGDKWKVEREVSILNAEVIILVKVFKKNKNIPVVVLSTLRLIDER